MEGTIYSHSLGNDAQTRQRVPFTDTMSVVGFYQAPLLVRPKGKVGHTWLKPHLWTLRNTHEVE